MELSEFAGVGPAMLRNFEQLGIRSFRQLANQDPEQLYGKLCRMTGKRQDPCVLDVFTCAIAQACDPNLPVEQRKWWYWSRARKQRAAGAG
jgi:hypothetical protein